MHPDDADDPVELLGTPLNEELNPPDGAADEEQDDGPDLPEAPDSTAAPASPTPDSPWATELKAAFGKGGAHRGKSNPCPAAPLHAENMRIRRHK